MLSTARAKPVRFEWRAADFNQSLNSTTFFSYYSSLVVVFVKHPPQASELSCDPLKSHDPNVQSTANIQENSGQKEQEHTHMQGKF